VAKKIEPPECFVGDVYQAKKLPRVPYTLAEALHIFEKSEFAKRAFGAEVHEHYSHFFRTEAQAYDRAVTDWERRRYFERI
jgi:glutamine synthetase